MRKPSFRTTLLSLALSLASVALAQDNTKRIESHSSFVSLRTSILLPSQGFNSENSELVPRIEGGFGFGAEGAYLFHKNLGIYASYQYAWLNSAQGLQTINDQWWVFESSRDWNSHLFGLAPYFSFPLTNIDIEFRLGPAYGLTRGYKHRALEKNTLDQERYISADFNSLWWQGGIMLRIDQANGWNVAFSYDYSYTNGKLALEDRYDNGTIVRSELPSIFSFSQVSLGVVYSIPHFTTIKNPAD